MNALTVNGKQLTVDGVEILGYGVPAPVLEEVTIGTQTWKTKNLAIDDGQGGIYTQTVNYGQGDVVEYYYTWNAAVRVAASIQGWHLPTPDEWDTLLDAVGGISTAGTKLKSTYGWNDDGNGTDDYRFNGLPAGQLYNSFINVGIIALFWTSAEYGSNGYFRSLETSANAGSGYNPKTFGYSVRLVKDAT